MPMGKGYGNKMMGDMSMGDMKMDGMMKGGMVLDGSRNAMRPINPNGRIDPGMTPAMRRTKTVNTNAMKMMGGMAPKGSKTVV